jgi:hypothetical protein
MASIIKHGEYTKIANYFGSTWSSSSSVYVIRISHGDEIIESGKEGH